MEFAELGARCDVKTCGQLDFLPSNCICGGRFCVAHAAPGMHMCAGAAQSRESSFTTGTVAVALAGTLHCAVAGCPVRIGLTACADCRSVACLAHRFPDQHPCVVAKASVAKGRAAAALVGRVPEPLPPAIATGASLRSTVVGSSPGSIDGGTKASGLADKVRRMRIKSRAVVNPSIPASSRMFFEVSWQLEGSGQTLSAPPTLNFCASREWTVSFLLDAICKAGGVRNPNLTVTDSSLRLHIYTASVPPRTKLCESLSTASGGAAATIACAASSEGCDPSSESCEIVGSAATLPRPLPFSSSLADLEGTGVLQDCSPLFVVRGLP